MKYDSSSGSNIEFIPLREEHIPLLRNWLKEPHVSEFWQETDYEEEFRQKFLSKLPDRGVCPYIIQVNSKPVGYIQHYEAQKVGGGWWPDAEDGTFGIDQFIGEPSLIGRGLGTQIIEKFVNELFQLPSVTKIITDPEPKNMRAIRAYEKAGFKPAGEIKTPGGDALLMVKTRPMTALMVRRLTPTDEAAFFTALHKWNEPNFTFASEFQPGTSFPDYLTLLADREAGRNLPPDRVPDTILYGFLGDEIIGRISIRHTLNDFLLKLGGHIGYGVLADHRRRGFAKSMLLQALPVAKDLGLNRVLLTCDDNNIGSIRTIEGCGGVLENKVSAGDGMPLKRRYWIDIK